MRDDDDDDRRRRILCRIRLPLRSLIVEMILVVEKKKKNFFSNQSKSNMYVSIRLYTHTRILIPYHHIITNGSYTIKTKALYIYTFIFAILNTLTFH